MITAAPGEYECKGEREREREREDSETMDGGHSNPTKTHCDCNWQDTHLVSCQHNAKQWRQNKDGICEGGRWIFMVWDERNYESNAEKGLSDWHVRVKVWF